MIKNEKGWIKSFFYIYKKVIFKIAFSIALNIKI